MSKLEYYLALWLILSALLQLMNIIYEAALSILRAIDQPKSDNKSERNAVGLFRGPLEHLGSNMFVGAILVASMFGIGWLFGRLIS